MQEQSKASTQVQVRSNNIVGSMITDEQLDLMVQASASTGIKSKGEALLMFMKAHELGLGAGNAIPHLHVVNGKTGIDIHIVKAILSRPSSGVSWKLIEDNVPVYNYSDGTNTMSDASRPINHVVLPFLNGNPKVDEEIAKGNYPVAILPNIKMVNNKPVKTFVPVDKRTTYEFTRYKRNIKGEWETIVTRSSFTWSEAVLAGLPLDRDGNYSETSAWAKYPKLMLGIRAFTLGARDIASDLLLGSYETSELMDIVNQDYVVQEDGEVTILKD